MDDQDRISEKIDEIVDGLEPLIERAAEELALDESVVAVRVANELNARLGPESHS